MDVFLNSGLPAPNSEGEADGALIQFAESAAKELAPYMLLHNWRLPEEAQRLVSEVEDCRQSAEGSELRQVEQLAAYLKFRANEYYDSICTTTGFDIPRVWGNLRVNLSFEAGPGFAFEELRKCLEDGNLRTVTRVIARSFLHLRAPEVGTCDGNILEMYGLATLLEASAHQISGLEVFPDDLRLDPSVIPPALSEGRLIDRELRYIASRLWSGSRPDFSELGLTCAILRKDEEVSRLMFNDEGLLLVVSSGFVLRAASGSIEDTTWVVFRLAHLLAGYQLMQEGLRPDGSCFEYWRTLKAIEMMEAAGCQREQVLDDLVQETRDEESQESASFGMYEYPWQREALPELRWRSSVAQDLLEPLVQLARSLG